MPGHKEDTFISDDEDNECPLCMEEFDLSDRNFKPCPCGYQVCQFCWNNIRNNPSLNGKCPACRRPYSEQTVEFKPISAEEWKTDHQKQTKLKNERKQREREKKESETASRKHLAGMRVVQKNLVYVIGLHPRIPLEDLHETLRGNDYFGQYGPVRKVVISRRGANGTDGIGVYVTYYKKDDAAKCIQAIDGVANDGFVLKANYGTTKYCSAYLRNQPCPNPHCMYLHDPGDESESFSRQDLSTYNFKQEGMSLPVGNSSSGMARSESQSEVTNRARYSNGDQHETESTDGPALPSTASWAARNAQKFASQPPPPANQQTAPSASYSTYPPPQQQQQQTSSSTQLKGKAKPLIKPAKPIVSPSKQLFAAALSCLSDTSFSYSFSQSLMDSPEFIEAESMSPLFAFDPEAGRKRREAARQAMKNQSNGKGNIDLQKLPPIHQAPHVRNQSRYNFSEINNGNTDKSNPYVAQQQSMMGEPKDGYAQAQRQYPRQLQQGRQSTSPAPMQPQQQAPPPPPPPGLAKAATPPVSKNYFGGQHDLLSHLMTGRQSQPSQQQPQHQQQQQRQPPQQQQQQQQQQQHLGEFTSSTAPGSGVGSGNGNMLSTIGDGRM